MPKSSCYRKLELSVALRYVFEYLEHDPVFVKLARGAGHMAKGRPDVRAWLQKMCPDYVVLNRVANATKHYRVTKPSPTTREVTSKRDEYFTSIFDIANGTTTIEIATLVTLTSESGLEVDVDVEEVLYTTRMFVFDLVKTHRPDRFVNRPISTINDDQ